MSIRTFIWGSCVSRDTFDFLSDDYQLIAYVARQSWISAGVSAIGVEHDEVSSAFQRRVIDGDVQGDVLERIHAAADMIDLLFIDLCDERLGVVDMGDSGVITRSVEKIQMGMQERLDGLGKVSLFGQEEHFRQWSSACGRIIGALDELQLRERTLVLAPAWASMDEESAPLPTSFGSTSIEMNVRYQRYYARLRAEGLNLAVVDRTLGASDHKWGRAAFHYHSTTYRELADATFAFTDSYHHVARKEGN